MKKIYFLTLLLTSSIFAEEIFLSVTKEGVPQKFVPSNVTVVTKQEIEKTNAKNVGELLDMLTVYDLSHYAGLGSQKTLRLRNSTADQVLVLIDGIPLNSSAKGSFNLSLLPIDIVEKIEILPGSASALYGANAVAGVVNVITKKSREVKPQIQPKINYGSFNTYSVDVNFDYNSTNYGTKLCLTNKHTDGWRENSQYDSISEFVNFSLPIFYGELNMNLLTNSSKLGVPGPATVPMEKWDGEVEKQASYPYAKQYDDVYFLAVSYKDKLVTTKLCIDKEKLLYDNSKDPVVWYQEKTNSEVVSINILNTISLPYQFSASLNYNYSQLDQQYLLNPVDNFKKDISDLSVAVQKEFKYENLNLIPTIRWDSNSLFGNKFSPQLIFVYNIHQTKFSLMAGTSWRTPTFLDLYWPNQGWAKGNPNLKPEESYSVDFAVEKKIQEVLFSVNLFYRYIKDQIRWYHEDPQNPWSAWTPSNVDETFVQGGEIKSCFTIAKIFKNQLSMLISDNRIKKKGEEEKGWQTQAYSPFLTLCYSSDLLLPYGFSLVNIAKYVDTQYSRDNESGTKLNSYILWNLRVEKKVSDFLNTYIQITDLFDQKGVNRAGYPQQGRSYEIGVTASLKI